MRKRCTNCKGCYICNKTNAMVTVQLSIKPYLAEYLIAKYAAPDGVVRFPRGSDLAETLYDVAQRPPKAYARQPHNLTVALPDRGHGKRSAVYNYVGQRGAAAIQQRAFYMFWAETAFYLNKAKATGGQIKTAGYELLDAYNIKSLTIDAVEKYYQRHFAKKFLHLTA